jgi:hypothetical protein
MAFVGRVAEEPGWGMTNLGPQGVHKVASICQGVFGVRCIIVGGISSQGSGDKKEEEAKKEEHFTKG